METNQVCDKYAGFALIEAQTSHAPRPPTHSVFPYAFMQRAGRQRGEATRQAIWQFRFDVRETKFKLELKLKEAPFRRVPSPFSLGRLH